jgi:hypothetical protein
MPQIGRSAKLYQERRLPDYMPTLRGPGPRLFLSDNPVNNIPLEAPLPAAKFLYNRKYVDGGKTTPWPSGQCGDCK